MAQAQLAGRNQAQQAGRTGEQLSARHIAVWTCRVHAGVGGVSAHCLQAARARQSTQLIRRFFDYPGETADAMRRRLVPIVRGVSRRWVLGESRRTNRGPIPGSPAARCVAAANALCDLRKGLPARRKLDVNRYLSSARPPRAAVVARGQQHRCAEGGEKWGGRATESREV